MSTAQLSWHPKLPLEEDRESGIGSTLDLSGSFEGCSQHTNQHKPSLKEADRLPREKGTRAGESHTHLQGWHQA